MASASRSLGMLRTDGGDKARRRRLGALMVGAAAAISFVFSVTLWFSGRELEGIFVGLWVPSILALGILALLVVRADSGRG